MRISLQLLAEKYEQVLEERQGVRISDDIRNQIISTFQQGITNNNSEDTNIIKLAQRFNLSTSTVTNLIRQSGVSGRARGVAQRGNITQRDSQKVFPTQIEYINKLISKKNIEPYGVYEYSTLAISNMVNEYIDAHPELNWHKPSLESISVYVTKWEKKNLEPGKTRGDYGIKTLKGGVYFRPGLKI